MTEIKVKLPEYFDISQIFDCGQCFRFDKVTPQNGGIAFGGTAFGRYVEFEQSEDGFLTVYGTNDEEFETVWKPFLSYSEDYGSLRDDIRTRLADCGVSEDVVTGAMNGGSGIRILRQDRWEALCSFIISQNNNIPRIKKNIADLCKAFGEEIGRGSGHYAFPTPEALREAGEDAIFALKTGFRAKYIYDAAEKVSSGKIDLAKIDEMTYDEGMAVLTSIKGVGPKVASCTLLFGFGKTESFPVDVWMKRVIAKYFPNGLEINRLGKYAGIAQQYLFYYERGFETEN